MNVPARLYVAEPAAHFERRPRLVVDASLLAALLFGEADAPQATAMLEGRALCAPALVGLELANVGMNKIRRGLIGIDDASAAIAEIDSLDVERFEVEPRDALVLAVRYRLSAYDAAYLWLAEHLEVPLATFDARLGEAARRHLPDPGRP